MSLFWLTFPPALFLLFPPVGVFHHQAVHYRAISRDWHRHWAQILSLRLHLLDLARAALGGWLMRQALLPGASAGTSLALQAGMLMVAVAAQMLCKAERAVLAPFTFVAGLVLGYCPITVGGFALALAVALSAGLRVPASFFPLLGIAVTGAGVFFQGPEGAPRVAVIAAAAVLPWLIMLLSRRRFVVAYLARHASRSSLRHTTLLR
jgi:hypothetical protein